MCKYCAYWPLQSKHMHPLTSIVERGLLQHFSIYQSLILLRRPYCILYGLLGFNSKCYVYLSHLFSNHPHIWNFRSVLDCKIGRSYSYRKIQKFISSVALLSTACFLNLLISFSTKTFICCQDRKMSLNLGNFEKYKSNRTQVNYYFWLNLTW